MNPKKIFFLNLLIIISAITSIKAQLTISMSTYKTNYEYGETIQLNCKITNPTNTLFEFVAGSHSSCQAEFIFNEINSYEYTACLTLTEILKFKPYSSKIYSWNIDPRLTGLPNADGIQQIVGTYYFGLSDTIYINAPQYLGGKLYVGYAMNDSSKVSQIKDSLNISVSNSIKIIDSMSESWEVTGHSIDSLISDFSKDSLIIFAEREMFISYESIIDESPLDYYPLQVGNKWYYSFEGQTYDTDPVPYSYLEKWETIGDTIMSNNIKYFISERYSNPKIRLYERIDTNNCIIYGYKDDENLENNEYLIADLKLPIASDLSNWTYHTNPILITYLTDTLMYVTSSEVIKKNTRSYFSTGGQYGNCYITKNVGISRYYYEFDFGYRSWSLDYAIVNGKTYGDSTLVSIKNNSQQIPNSFTLSQNYPNPFNPTTTIKYTIPHHGGQANVASGFSLSKVVLKVYDILGKEVSALVDEIKSPGEYIIDFDASTLSSGVYYYQLVVGDFINTKKMILMK